MKLLLNVALLGSLALGSSPKELSAEYKVVLIALVQSGQLPASSLVTYLSAGVLSDETAQVMAKCKDLNLSKMLLRRLPAHVLWQMTSVETLILDSNIGLKITMDDIKRMSRLPIKTVSIHSSDISSETFRSILRLPNLTSLDITGNLRIGEDYNSFRGFKRMKSLKRLTASNINLSGESFNEICKCKSLKELNVFMNRELGSSTFDFGKLKNRLVKLNIGDTNLGENSLISICRFPKLKVLDISLNGILGPVMSRSGFSFGGLQGKLTRLDVSGTNITSSRAIGAISRCRRLRGLDISCNLGLWKDAGDIDFGYLRSGLWFLNARVTGLPPAVLHRVFGFDQLKFLDVSYNDEVCRDLDSSRQILGGVRNTLKEIKLKGIGLARGELQWIVREFTGLERVNAKKNMAITPVDVVGLGSLNNRVVRFEVSSYDGMPNGYGESSQGQV